MRGRLVDVVASDAVLDDRPVDVDESPAAPTAGHKLAPQPVPAALDGESQQPAATSFATARTVDMICRARLRKLELDERQKKLVDTTAVRRTISDAVRALRDGILGIPDRLAATLAAEADQKTVAATLKTELSRELEGLANAIADL
jgi:hypothetical protein